MSVCCECCVLPGRGLCDELITRPGVLLSVVRRCVWFRNLVNEKAMSYWGGGCCAKTNQRTCRYPNLGPNMSLNETFGLCCLIKSTVLDDWLTVYRSITLVDFQHDAQNSYLFIYSKFIKILYMFRALPCSTSGGLRRNCIYGASGIVTLCRWLSCAPVMKELYYM
jgi:hypothetical protein